MISPLTTEIIGFIGIILIILILIINNNMYNFKCNIPIKADIIDIYVDDRYTRNRLGNGQSLILILLTSIRKIYSINVSYIYNDVEIKTLVKNSIKVWAWKAYMLRSKKNTIVYVDPDNPTFCIIKRKTFWQDADDFDLD